MSSYLKKLVLRTCIRIHAEPMLRSAKEQNPYKYFENKVFFFVEFDNYD